MNLEELLKLVLLVLVLQVGFGATAVLETIDDRIKMVSKELEGIAGRTAKG